MAVCLDQTATSCGGLLVKGNRHLTFDVQVRSFEALIRQLFLVKFDVATKAISKIYNV